MARIISFEGRKISVPDDASDDEVNQIVNQQSLSSSQTPAPQPQTWADWQSGNRDALGDFMLNTTKALGGGARDFAIGTSTLLPDVGSFLAEKALNPVYKAATGEDYVPDVADKYPSEMANQFLPDVEVKGITTNMVRAATPYVAGALTGQGLLKDGAGLVKRTLAGGLGDFVATNPDKASTVGDIFNLPTQINQDDNPLLKRAKVATEGLFINPAVQGGLWTGAKAGGLASDLLADLGHSLFPTKGLMNREAARAAQKVAGTDKDNIINAITENKQFSTPESPVMSGNLSQNDDMIRLQKAVTAKDQAVRADNRQSMLGVQQAAEDNLAKKFSSDLSRQGEDMSPALKESTMTERTALLAEKNAAKSRAESGLAQSEAGIKSAEADLKAIQDELGSGDVTGASLAIAKSRDNALSNATAVKNEKFANVDPNFSVEANASPLQEKSLTTTSNNPLIGDANIPTKDVARINATIADAGLDDIPDELRGFAANLLEGSKKAADPVTIGALREYIPDVSRRIEDAVVQGKGALASKLSEFKDAAIESIRQTGGEDADKFFKAMADHEGDFVPTKQAAENLNSLTSKSTDIDAVVRKYETVNNLDKVANEKKAYDLVKAHFARTINESNPSSAVVNKFKNANEDILKKYPKLKADIDKYANRIDAAEKGKIRFSENKSQFEKDIQAAQKDLDVTSSDIKKSSIGKMIDFDNPLDAVKKVMGSKNKLQEMRKLAAAAKKDVSGNATHGLRDTFKEYLLEQSTRKGHITHSDNIRPLKSGEDIYIPDKDTTEVMKGLYTPDEMKVFERGRKQLEFLTAHERVKGVDKAGDVIGAQDSGYGNIMAAIISGNYKSFRVLNSVFKKMKNPADEIQYILADAFTNPDNMLKLLQKPTESNIARFVESLDSLRKSYPQHLSNNLLATSNEEKETTK